METIAEYKARARAWVEANLEPLNGADPFMGHAADDREQVVRAKMIMAKLHQGGYSGICYPTEYGGQGLTKEHQDAFSEAAEGYELPLLFNTPTLTIIMPTVLDYGTEEQKQRYIPAMLRGEELWVQFLSEPTGGSDLAGALTKATRDGDVFVLSGSKIWSTYAWKSDYAVCVCRTNWEVPKHRGLSVLIVKVHQPGIQIDQIRHVDGTEEFCQEFFDDVPIPVENLLGKQDDGWTVASRLLFHERSAVGGASPHMMGGNAERAARRAGGLSMGDLAAKVGRSDDPHVRQLIGEAKILEHAHEALVERVSASIASGRLPSPAGSIPRLSSGMMGVRMASIAIEIAGDHSAAWEEGDPTGKSGIAYIGRQGACLGGGSTEMARNIISERVLGMPRERSDDVDRPFKDVRTNTMPGR